MSRKRSLRNHLDLVRSVLTGTGGSETSYFLPCLPPTLLALAMADVVADVTGTLFGTGAFLGFLTSRFERVWPLAISVSFADGYSRHKKQRILDCRTGGGQRRAYSALPAHIVENRRLEATSFREGFDFALSL